MMIDNTSVPFSLGAVVYYLDTETPRKPMVHEEIVKSIEIIKAIKSQDPNEEPEYEYIIHFESGRWALPSEVTYMYQNISRLITKDFTSFEEIFNIEPAEAKILFNTKTPCTK